MEELSDINFFLKLFNEVFLTIRKRYPKISDEKISGSVQEIIDYFRENRGPGGACATDRFLRVKNFLAFFYFHSVLSAAATRDKVLEALEHCPEFRNALHREPLNVVNVGGASGSDIVGLYSAIPVDPACKNMNITLIDHIDWNKYFEEIHRLLRENNYGNASLLFTQRSIRNLFILDDMEQEITPESKREFGKADVVWMKGFLSTLSSNFDRKCVTERILSNMKPGALLLVMDSPSYDQFDDFVDDNQLRRLYHTSSGYDLPPLNALEFPPNFCHFLNAYDQEMFVRNTNQLLIIFQKMKDKKKVNKE